MGRVLPYERWLVRFAELTVAELAPVLGDAADDAELATDASWWQGYLSDGLCGSPAYDDDHVAADGAEGPKIPIMVVDVGLEEAGARSLVTNLFGALFEGGARAYAGTTAGEGDDWEVLCPYFVVVIEGRRVAYEGEWLLGQFLVDGPWEDALRALHGRLSDAVWEWESGR